MAGLRAIAAAVSPCAISWRTASPRGLKRAGTRRPRPPVARLTRTSLPGRDQPPVGDVAGDERWSPAIELGQRRRFNLKGAEFGSPAAASGGQDEDVGSRAAGRTVTGARSAWPRTKPPRRRECPVGLVRRWAPATGGQLAHVRVPGFDHLHRYRNRNRRTSSWGHRHQPQRTRRVANAVRVHLIPGIGAHRLQTHQPQHLERCHQRMNAAGSAPALHTRYVGQLEPRSPRP